MLKRLSSFFRHNVLGNFGHTSSNENDNNFYVSLGCIIKDENEYLEEWIKYHLKIGVEHFYIYDNGSRVRIEKTIKAIGLSGYVTVISMPGKARQIKAYAHCVSKFGHQSRWIGFIDTDEFIVPKATAGNLPAFLKDYENYGGLGVNWVMFGSSGHLKRTNRPQLESFTMRAEDNFDVHRHIKSIVQPQYVDKVLGAHSFAYKDGKYVVNENFVRIEGSFSETSVKKIQLNHYYCRSLEEYQAKVQRGYGDTRKKRKLDEFYRHDSESNKFEEQTILDILRAGETEGQANLNRK